MGTSAAPPGGMNVLGHEVEDLVRARADEQLLAASTP